MAQAVTDNFNPPTSHVFVRAALAMLLLWIAFPPVGLSMSGWIAVMPLVSLVVEKGSLRRADYGKIWFAGLLYWLATLYFIPIPHPALWLGWIALSMYLACYFPFFVLSGRTMIGRFRIPVFVAVPVAWVGLELLRAHVFTGFGLVFLSHTQYQNPLLIQISDLSGAYTLSFAMTVFAAAAHQFFFARTDSRRPYWSQLVPAFAALAVVIGYGQFTWNQQSTDEDNPLVVALIQGSIDTVLTADKEQAEAIHRKKNGTVSATYSGSSADVERHSAGNLARKRLALSRSAPRDGQVQNAAGRRTGV